ncbi:glycerate kinase [Chlorogloeopsis fritschii PCC 9212]|uniref:Glycerate kinase n=1 Tax=Chlorogloeopsis fritschii PCC 6912 TaxID=211165 RepID=A0A433N894_CHLFR|nr:glycerate kinase [Chlorogloeopsis fritschii]RUR77890.1 glycerate kinase [Chlorogloeopsis fritschii PCC 6912]
MTLRVLIAPSGFKESLAADEVADCIATGVLRTIPDAKIRKAPLVDGGEGFTKALVAATGGSLHSVRVTGPVGQLIESHYGFLGGTDVKTAVLEMAAAAGLRLVPRDARDPLKTTTYGVGELIKAALDAGAEQILVGCGDSGTNDGGAGMAQALGIRLLDAAGNELERGGGELIKLHTIDMSQRDSRLEQVKIDVACNWHNLLCGEKGVARVFGPQKGASPETVEQLAAALDRYADVIEQELGIDVREMPGSGASGGLGTGLYAFLGATLHPRYDIVMQYLELDSLLQESDLVITAEGSIDFQTPRGKIPVEVAQRAKRYYLPVIAIAGTIGKDARVNFDYGIDSFSTILKEPCSLPEAIANTPELLTYAAERVMRLVKVGQKLAQSVR